MSNSSLFQSWGKTPRLYRPVTITEKIDGSNAAVVLIHESKVTDEDLSFGLAPADGYDGTYFSFAQSRNRMIMPGADNFGFAGWVQKNTQRLFDILGPGRHFGEWWGKGIQRGYGLDHRRFSLFDTSRHGEFPSGHVHLPTLSTVPVLFRGVFSQWEVDDALGLLRSEGSVAKRLINSSGERQSAEGVIVYHQHAGQVFKVLLEDDHLSKTERGVA